jgi:hypothetical protein
MDLFIPEIWKNPKFKMRNIRLILSRTGWRVSCSPGQTKGRKA